MPSLARLDAFCHYYPLYFRWRPREDAGVRGLDGVGTNVYIWTSTDEEKDMSRRRNGYPTCSARFTLSRPHPCWAPVVPAQECLRSQSVHVAETVGKSVETAARQRLDVEGRTPRP